MSRNIRFLASQSLDLVLWLCIDTGLKCDLNNLLNMGVSWALQWDANVMATANWRKEGEKRAEHIDLHLRLSTYSTLTDSGVQ